MVCSLYAALVSTYVSLRGHLLTSQLSATLTPAELNNKQIFCRSSSLLLEPDYFTHSLRDLSLSHTMAIFQRRPTGLCGAHLDRILKKLSSTFHVRQGLPVPYPQDPKTVFSELFSLLFTWKWQWSPARMHRFFAAHRWYILTSWSTLTCPKYFHCCYLTISYGEGRHWVAKSTIFTGLGQRTLLNIPNASLSDGNHSKKSWNLEMPKSFKEFHCIFTFVFSLLSFLSNYVWSHVTVEPKLRENIVS